MSAKSQESFFLTLAEAVPLVEAELERARRYGRSLCVAVVRGDRVHEFPRRIPDLFMALDDEQVMIIAPETDALGMAAFTQRLCAATDARLEGMAAFPDDGLTLSALWRKALEETTPRGVNEASTWHTI